MLEFRKHARETHLDRRLRIMTRRGGGEGGLGQIVSIIGRFRRFGGGGTIIGGGRGHEGLQLGGFRGNGGGGGWH